MVKQTGPPEVLELVNDYPVPKLRDGEVPTVVSQCNGVLNQPYGADRRHLAFRCEGTNTRCCTGAMKMIFTTCADNGYTSCAMQVLVRQHSTSVNPVDYKIRAGAFKAKLPKVKWASTLRRNVH